MRDLVAIDRVNPLGWGRISSIAPVRLEKIWKFEGDDRKSLTGSRRGSAGTTRDAQPHRQRRKSDTIYGSHEVGEVFARGSGEAGLIRGF